MVPSRVQLKYDRWSAQLGGQAVIHGFFQPQLNYQGAFLYELNDQIRLRGSAGSASRLLAPFYFQRQRAEALSDNPRLRERTDLTPVRSRSMDLGLRYDRPLFQSEISFFQQRLINPHFYDETANLDNLFIDFGYEHRPDTYVQLIGLQGSLRWTRILRNTNLDLNWQLARGRQEYRTDEGPIDHLAGQPAAYLQARVNFRFWERYFLQVDQVFSSSFYTYRRGVEKRPAYHTLNLRTRVELSRNFQLSLSIHNLFDTNYAGLDATGTPDDLLFNPQTGRLIQLSAGYRLE